MKDMYPNHGALWNNEDDQRLAELYQYQTSIPDLMTLFGRSRTRRTEPMRFDIIAIVGSGANAEIRHTKNTFNVFNY